MTDRQTYTNAFNFVEHTLCQ